jgi:hypothetical protein
MTVRVDAETVWIEGNSLVEDAEAVLVAVQDVPGRAVDLVNASRLHSATIQLLVALKPKVRGVPSDPFQACHLARLLGLDGDDSTRLG